MPEAPSLTVVIVTFGKPELVANCLESLRECAGEVDRLSVVVVDNASPDDTADVVAERFPEVKLLREPRNGGFAVANNRALRAVDSPWVLLLNPDTQLLPGTLAHVLEQGAEHPEAGVIGCRLETADGTFDHASKRQIPTPASALRYFFRGGRRDSSYLAPDVDERGVGYVEAINGAFMLVRVDAMRTVGLLSEKYWMYGEDLDWYVRFTQAGWRILYDGRVTCVHLKGAISGRARSLRLNWHFHKSMLVFFNDHAKSGNILLDATVRVGIAGRFLTRSARDGVVRAGERIRAIRGVS